MAVTRRFLNWNRPALPAAAAFLIDEYSMLETVDLSGVVVVVPGRRAGRRLLELLVEAADSRLLRLTPPVIETAGRLPERLYEPKLRFASDLVNKFAWTAALRELDDDSIRHIIPDPPKDHDISRWLSFGELLWKQHRELAAEGIDFQDVVDRGPEVDAFDEAERWGILRSIQQACLRKLDAVELWDLQSARLFAIKHHECRTDKDIVLVGTSDLNTATCEMLEQVSERVTTLIHAPLKLWRRFDSFGCIIPDAWGNVTIDLDSQKIAVAEGPVDQAEAVVATLAGYMGRFRMDEVTVGVTDERLVPEIDRHLAAEGVASRWVVGQQLSESRPYRLLAAVAEFLETNNFDSFASLIRHTDLDAWLARQPVEGVSQEEAPAGAALGLDVQAAFAPQTMEWLKQLDDYFNRHLPAAPGDWIVTEARQADVDRIQHIHHCVTSLLSALSESQRPLSEWVQPLNGLLLMVYNDVEFDLETTEDSCTLAACTKIHDLLLTHSDIPPSLLPTVEAAQAIRLLLKELINESVPPPANDDAVELLGWLELPLDDSPALVVTTFNEGYVPSSLNSDAFLPNELRRHLGLLDNRRRYARDAYALSAMAASRSDLQLIVGRRDMRGDPLRPSRLLFAAEPTEIAQRILTCFGDVDGAVVRHYEGASGACEDGHGFTVPRPVPLARPVRRIGVTSFRTYLACPYRFYLRHVLHLKDVDDSASELDALMFGNLMHEVLSRFGDSSAAASLAAHDIRKELDTLLFSTVHDMFGKERLAAVNVQVMQIQARLSAFADWQANWAAQGWRIKHTEASFRNEGVKLQLHDGRTVELDGRIDRIDQLGDSNHYVIFDYKSSENARPPRSAHQKKDEWVDLQLPLYRHLVKHLGLEGDIKLGYIVLPKDTKEVKSLMADWTDDELKDADATAIEVATNILDEQFWPPADVNPMFFQEFSAICQDNVFDREVIA